MGYVLCRTVVVINGKKAIHEALVTRSLDFADRPESYIYRLMNISNKGYELFIQLSIVGYQVLAKKLGYFTLYNM